MEAKLKWAELTWNPMTGCSKISPGCKHCYAERMALRLKAMGQEHFMPPLQGSVSFLTPTQT